jgi:uncharacterized membrane protein
MDDLLVAITLATALGCGLSAGVFFAFSAFVMRALARLGPAQGLGAMQAINVTAVTPAFMTALFGTAAACVAVVVWEVASWNEASGPWLVAGSALYLVGPIGLTMAYHVPRNNALAALEPATHDAEAKWRRYLAEWTRWNHARAVLAIAAAGALTEALHVG